MSSTELVTIPTNGVDTYRMSTDAATICGAIVKQTATSIQGRQYVACTGWQAIAVAHGCAASSCDVARVDGGFRATGQVRRMDTGAIIAEAEGFVGEDEPTWFGGEVTDKWGKKKVHPKRADFAIRAMAQTRAISRACRSAFAHVVVLIDKELGTTPAEEMQAVYDHDPEFVPQKGYTHAGAADEAVNDGLASGTKSTYRIKAEGNAKKWTDTAIETLKFASIPSEIDGWWADNVKATERLFENHPDEFARLEKASQEQRDALVSRAA